MRVILIIFGISLLIFMGMGFGMSYIYPPYPLIAKNFFEAIARKEYTIAYAMFSKPFKQNIDFQNFQSFIENSEYISYKEGRWFNNAVGKYNGTLDGVITLKSGKRLSLQFSFITEPDPQWANLLPSFLTQVVGEVTVWRINEIRSLDAN